MLEADRRQILKGLAGLPLGVILSDRVLAQEAASGTQEVRLTLPDGKNVHGALAKPAKLPAPAILLVHEWWGLNDQIKTMAVELAKQGYLAVALDLFNGKVATTPDEAKNLIANVDQGEAKAIMAAWIDWLKSSSDCNGKVATLGWCFGGGWSLVGSLVRPVDATVIYYGRVNLPAADLQALKGPVLGQFAKKDQSITPEMVKGFQQEMAKAGKSLELYEYDADHAFANPTGNRYDKEDAMLAWKRTLAFLKKNIG